MTVENPTHWGWFLFCPVLFRESDHELGPIWGWLDWLFECALFFQDIINLCVDDEHAGYVMWLKEIDVFGEQEDDN
jgi:hypothetical protein